MPKRPRMSFPRPLSGVVEESLVGLGLADRLREAEIWRIWADVVGAAIACRAHPVRIINGTLTVAVTSAPWMQELRFMTAMMKEKLNIRLGAEIVKEIVLKAGRVDKQTTEVQEKNSPPRQLTSDQLALIEMQASSIEDPETRQAFFELMQVSMEQPR
jgi:predicted nucleic acid-binding Zn ribbon protein